MKNKMLFFSAMVCSVVSVLLGGCGHDRDKDFSALQTPESQEEAYEYKMFFIPEKDGTVQPYVGDTMPYYENDTLWYASSDSRFGPYSEAKRLEGKLFYAAKHVEDGKNTYMVGWARRSEYVAPGQTYSFTYIQEGSVGIFYIDDVAALTVRLYGVSGKPIRLFAGNNSVTFSNLQQYTR